MEKICDYYSFLVGYIIGLVICYIIMSVNMPEEDVLEIMNYVQRISIIILGIVALFFPMIDKLIDTKK